MGDAVCVGAGVWVGARVCVGAGAAVRVSVARIVGAVCAFTAFGVAEGTAAGAATVAAHAFKNKIPQSNKMD